MDNEWEKEMQKEKITIMKVALCAGALIGGMIVTLLLEIAKNTQH